MTNKTIEEIIQNIENHRSWDYSELIQVMGYLRKLGAANRKHRNCDMCKIREELYGVGNES